MESSLQLTATRQKRPGWFSPLARPLLRQFDLTVFVLKRQWHHPGLTLLAMLGIVLAVGLVANASCFSEAASQLMLNQKLAEFSRTTGRPPFSITAYTFPSTRKPISLEAAEQAASDVAHTLASEVGLPLEHVGVQVRSGGMMLQPREGSSLYGEESLLGTVELAYIAGVGDHMQIIAGEPLGDDGAGEVLDVWMHTRLAERMGIHIGEELEVGVTLVSPAIPFRVKGIWQAGDPTDEFWFSNPDSALKDVLLVGRQGYITFVEPLLPSKTGGVYWHVILDESRATPASANRHIEGFERALGDINRYLPDVRLDSPPLEPLEEFVSRETTLLTLLLSFNIPALGFLLCFLFLTSVMIARWQQRDTAVLVSRGAGLWNILVLTAIEQMLLFIIGLPLGVGLGMALALAMGYTSSFLSFTPRPPVPVALRGVDLRLALAALGVTLCVRLWSAARAARRSVVQVEREQARPLQAPFWYRYYLDLLLVFPTAYAYHQLHRRGTLAMLVQDRLEDLYRDPLLILVPGLFIVTITLLILRVFPLVMRAIDGIAGALPWVTPHLALRQLSRYSAGYINPLLLIAVSLALGVYTLSLAASLDRWLEDRMYYRVGADLAFEPHLPPDQGTGSGPPDVGQEAEPASGVWIPLPHEFLGLPGVVAATRVGDYPMEVELGSEGEGTGRFLAVDRLDFPSVAWFRRDLAQEPLGALMNHLALSPENILVPRQFLNQHHLQIGDKVRLSVTVSQGVRVNDVFTVIGTFDHFPTAYEDAGVTIVGNLERLSDILGLPPPHSIWLRTKEDVAGEVIFDMIPRMGIEPGKPLDARALINDEKAKTERVGVFGTLSIGFVAAVAMAGMGLLLHSYASLRERLYGLAVLRAIGLNLRQVIIQVTMEYTALTVCGATIGALVGVTASRFFAPFFTVTGEKAPPLPPLIPVIARQDVAYLVIAFVVIMVVLGIIVIARAFSRQHFDLLRAHWG